MASPPTQPPSLQYEAAGRWGHYSAIVDGKNYTYGGHCGAGGFPTLTAVDIFDLETELWQQTPTSGEHPQGFVGASCAVIGVHIFHFGGHDESKDYNSIHCLNTTDLSWSAIPATNAQEAPMSKHGARMLVHENTLVISAGYGVLPDQRLLGREYIPDPDHDGEGWTNELHCYVLVLN